MDLRETRAALRRYGISPSRLMGQNFLIDEAVAEREVEAAQLRGGEVVLEVGPGLGALTEHILARGCRVVAVEKDPALARALEDRLASDRLEVVNDDVLEIELPCFEVVVSNIPYSISTPLTFKLLEHGFSRAVLTYQEEFAARLVAQPGDPEYSRLSVAASYYAEVEVLGLVPAKAFYPKPKVRSAIVRLRPRAAPVDVDEKLFFNLVRGLFTVKRKTVKNALAVAEKVSGVEVELEALPREVLRKRVYELSLEELRLLSRACRALA